MLQLYINLKWWSIISSSLQCRVVTKNETDFELEHEKCCIYIINLRTKFRGKACQFTFDGDIRIYDSL